MPKFTEYAEKWKEIYIKENVSDVKHRVHLWILSPLEKKWQGKLLELDIFYFIQVAIFNYRASIL